MSILDLKKSSGVLLDLNKSQPTMKNMRVKISWKMHPVYGKSLTDGFDLDIFVFSNKDGKVGSASDVIFFNNKRANGVSISADERTGGEEIVDFDVSSLTMPSYDVFVCIHEYASRNQKFGMIADAKVELINKETNQVFQTYLLNESFASDTAVHVGNVENKGGGFSFTPIGLGAVADPNQIIANYM